MNAIIFTSNSGTTEQYAKMISERCGIPAYSLDESYKNLKKGEEVIFLGWIMAGVITGYKEVMANYNPVAVCAIGLLPPKDGLVSLRNSNGIDNVFPLFFLQGGYYPEKLKGIKKVLIKVVSKSIIKEYRKRECLTAEDKRTLAILENGGDCISDENIGEIISWIECSKGF